MPTPYTPGPWKTTLDFLVIQNPQPATGKEKYVAKVVLDGAMRMPKREREANARLISSAPELLEACKMVLENVEKDGYVNAGILTDVQAAIAKATFL